MSAGMTLRWVSDYIGVASGFIICGTLLQPDGHTQRRHMTAVKDDT